MTVCGFLTAPVVSVVVFTAVIVSVALFTVAIVSGWLYGSTHVGKIIHCITKILLSLLFSFVLLGKIT